MARLKLTEDVIDIICDKLKLRLKWKEIAAILGVEPATIRNWIRDGKKAKSGIKRQLYDAIEETKADLIAEYSKIVRNHLLHGTKTTTTKTVIDKDGNTRTEIIEKETPPDADFALKVLAIIDPAHWSQVQNIKIDWQKPLQDAGVDPKQMEQAFFAWMELKKDELPTNFIPEVPGREV